MTDNLKPDSPLPWRWGDGPSWMLGNEGIVDADGDPVMCNSGRGSGDPTDADAAYIVRAVNAHADLLAACQEAVLWSVHDPNCRSRRHEGCDCHIGRIEAAIAKATG